MAAMWGPPSSHTIRAVSDKGGIATVGNSRSDEEFMQIKLTTLAPDSSRGYWGSRHLNASSQRRKVDVMSSMKPNHAVKHLEISRR